MGLFRCLFISLLVASCSTNSIAPVSSRNGKQKKPPQTEVQTQQLKTPSAPATIQKRSHHKVVSGDTLYSISWNYNLDYKAIAAWNNIKTPYVIYLGQSLRLTVPPTKKAIPKETISKKISRVKAKPTVIKPTVIKPVVQKTPATKKATKKIENVQYTKKINWHWPTTGKLLKSNSPISKNGLNIAGKTGQLIKASGDGVVVYSGNGLLGYGRLIIIKHNQTYLSAYAHNSALLVKEGDHVASGQQIAKMGKDSNGQTLLHFEIRKNGTPVVPTKYLPKSQI